MPPKSDYWKHFVVQGVLAVCQLPGCPKPNVSLGAPPKPGQKKRISEYKLFHSCSKLKMFSFSIWRSHQPFGKASPIWVECILWDKGKEGGTVASEVKEEVKESCEMENSEVRFYDVRSNANTVPVLSNITLCRQYPAPHITKSTGCALQ